MSLFRKILAEHEADKGCEYESTNPCKTPDSGMPPRNPQIGSVFLRTHPRKNRDSVVHWHIRYENHLNTTV